MLAAHLSYISSPKCPSCSSLFEHQLTHTSALPARHYSNASWPTQVPQFLVQFAASLSITAKYFLFRHPQFIFQPYNELCNLLVCWLFVEFCVFRRVCKIAKTTSCFVMSVSLEQLCSHWTDFYKIWYLTLRRLMSYIYVYIYIYIRSTHSWCF